jgi:RNA:NAD 2'-phosphotransferase (TPT1/KptA family)
LSWRAKSAAVTIPIRSYWWSDAAAAARAGVVFHPVDEHVWLVDAVPPEHVRRS